MLGYPRPEGFAQGIRQRRRALDADIALLIVEGKTDRKALSPFLHESVHVVQARGRENVVAAFDLIDESLQASMVFLVDCDGGIESRLKGHANLVITANRDLEADLLFELNALTRAAHEYLGMSFDSVADVASAAGALLDQATAIVGRLGRLLDGARSAGYKGSPDVPVGR